MKEIFKKKIGVALGSGGAKGISHIGVLEVFERNNIKIDEISGCSIGAIIGGIYAAGVTIEKIKDIALSINLKKMWELFDFTRPTSGGVVRGELVEKFLNDILPVKKFEDLKIPFKCVATDIKTEEEVVFDKGDLVPAIRASISIPGVFIPFNYQGGLFVDGGVVNPVPANLLTSVCKIAVVVEEYETIRKLISKKEVISQKIKNIVSGKFNILKKYLPVKKANKTQKYGMIKVLSSAVDAIQKELLYFNLDKYNVNYIIKPEVEDIATLGFYDGYESYRRGVEAAEKFLAENGDKLS